MSKELTTQTEDPFYGLIEQAMQQENGIDVVERMLDAQERVMNKNAEIAFNKAMNAAQNEMPVIAKTTKAHNSKYAKYEDIDKVARPIYSKHGFGISYGTKPSQVDGFTVYFAEVTHDAGHTKYYEREFPSDASGSKNAIQAKASAESYAKRYLLIGIFNIVTCDEDDDGNMARVARIDENQVKQLERLLEASQADKSGFLNYMEVDALENISSADFQKARVALNKKAAQK